LAKDLQILADGISVSPGAGGVLKKNVGRQAQE
jgi:hypothetical protein